MQRIKQIAFTLIELLVVIAIIGILSGLIIVTMNGVTSKANIAKAKVFSNSLKNALMMNLVSEWKFDGTTADGSPATANDVKDTWKNINNGTMTYPPTVKTSDCVSGSCLQFDGVDDYVDCGSGAVFTSTTKSMWIKTSSSSNAGFFSWNGGSSYGGISIVSGRILYYGGTGYKYWQNFGNIFDNNWHNIVISVSDTSNIPSTGTKLYIDGIEKINIYATSAGGSLNGNINIGRTNYGYFNGSIDEIRIYDAAMPTSQIKEQYYAGLNKLLANGGVDREEYLSRINEVNNQTAKNQ